MRLEEMKNEIPETPEFIHAMIQNEVKKQLQKTKVVNIRTRRQKRWTGVKTAAAAVCVLAVSTITYAGTQFYHMFTEQQATYRIEIGIQSDDSTGRMKLPAKIHDIDLQAGYIPEGMEWSDRWHLEYSDCEQSGGFSFSSVLFDEDDLGKVMQDEAVIDSELRTFGNYEGVYLRYNDIAGNGAFNQRIYLFCPEVYRVITIYIGADISKEDALKVAENLVITENDTMIDTNKLYTWSEIAGVQEDAAERNILDSVAESKLPIHSIGEAFEMSVSGEDSEGQIMAQNKISVRVDSVQLADDLNLLDKNYVPEKWFDAVGADGTFEKNTLSYVKSGDGIDSVDEIVKTESVKQKLVYATVSYTNESAEEIHHICYNGTLLSLSHKKDAYQIYNPREHSGDGYDRIVWNGAAGMGAMAYSDVSEAYGDGGNYISSLKPGESIQVNMAWIVNENDLNDMYLYLGNDGAAYEFSDLMLQIGVVEIVDEK